MPPVVKPTVSLGCSLVKCSVPESNPHLREKWGDVKRCSSPRHIWDYCTGIYSWKTTIHISIQKAQKSPVAKKSVSQTLLSMNFFFFLVVFYYHSEEYAVENTVEGNLISLTCSVKSSPGKWRNRLIFVCSYFIFVPTFSIHVSWNPCFNSLVSTTR